MSTPPITPTQVSAPPIRPPQAEGFLGGVYDVVGPQLAAAQEDERRQKLAEQDFYFQRLHDPNLSVQPNDTPDVADAKRRQYQMALDEYAKRSPKQAKPLVQTLGQLIGHLHGHGPQGVQAPGAPGSQTPVGPSAQPGPPQGTVATPPFLPPGTASATPQAAGTKGGGTGASPAIPPPPTASVATAPIASAGPAIPPPPNAADMAATSRAGQTGFDLATKNTAEKNQLAAALASHQQGELAEPGIIRQQLDEIAKLPQEQQLPAMMKMGMFPASMLRPVTKLVPNDPSNPAAGGHYESFSPLMGLLGGQEPAGFISPGWAGTQKSASSLYNPDTGVTASSSSTKKVLGSVGGGRPAAIPAPPSGGSGGGGGASTGTGPISQATAPGKPGGRIASMAQDYADFGKVPAGKDSPAVETYMRAHGMQPGVKPTTQEINLSDAVRKTEPKLQQMTDFLEKNKLTDQGQGGMFSPSALMERMKVQKAWEEYSHGIPPKDKQLGQLIKFAAALKVMGAAPWMSMSRGKYMYQEVAQHLPSTTDTPAQLYEKAQFFKSILDDTKASLPPQLLKPRGNVVAPPPQGGPRTAEEYLQSIGRQ